MTDAFMSYRELLAHHQLRVTPQRLMILQAIDAGHGHLTAEEIGESVRTKLPSIHLGTIYRTLETLRDEGIISETRFGDRAAMYELVGIHPHHHLCCEQCGAVWEIADTLFEPLRKSIESEYGFQARTEHFAIFGLCAYCAQQAIEH